MRPARLVGIGTGRALLGKGGFGGRGALAAAALRLGLEFGLVVAAASVVAGVFAAFGLAFAAAGRVVIAAVLARGQTGAAVVFERAIDHAGAFAAFRVALAAAGVAAAFKAGVVAAAFAAVAIAALAAAFAVGDGVGHAVALRGLLGVAGALVGGGEVALIVALVVLAASRLLGRAKLLVVIALMRHQVVEFGQLLLGMLLLVLFLVFFHFVDLIFGHDASPKGNPLQSWAIIPPRALSARRSDDATRLS